MLDISHIEAPTIRDIKLPANPTIVIIGAYKGDTAEFVRIHHPTAFMALFEPQAWAFDKLADTFHRDPRVWLSNCALGLEDGEATIYEYGTDAASLMYLPDSRAHRKANVCEARRMLDFLHNIDFAIVNCEGLEYFLLPYIVDQLHQAKVLVQEHTVHATLSLEKGFGYTLGKSRQDIGKGWYLYE